MKLFYFFTALIIAISCATIANAQEYSVDSEFLVDEEHHDAVQLTWRVLGDAPGVEYRLMHVLGEAEGMEGQSAILMQQVGPIMTTAPAGPGPGGWIFATDWVIAWTDVNEGVVQPDWIINHPQLKREFLFCHGDGVERYKFHIQRKNVAAGEWETKFIFIVKGRLIEL